VIIDDYIFIYTLGFIEALNLCSIAFDHHMPGESLKKLCAERNILHIPGIDMYYPQMYRQWELFMANFPECNNVEWPTMIKKAENMAKQQ
jgi:hypothetical protein